MFCDLTKKLNTVCLYFFLCIFSFLLDIMAYRKFVTPHIGPSTNHRSENEDYTSSNIVVRNRISSWKI